LSKELERLVSQDYAMETKLVHKFDVDQFRDRIQKLFDYYNTTSSERKIAPYFPLIQSSGMGKTKIFVEFKRSAAEAVILLECTKRIPQKRKLSDHFTAWFVAPSEQGDEKEQNSNRDLICDTLFSLVETERKNKENNSLRVVILFDEAQHLLDNNGFAFRCVRWWLRRQTTKNVVAVFSGTTSSLANFFKDPPDTSTSRDASFRYRKGIGLYPPLYDIHSIGIFSNNGTVGGAASEYEEAIPYGRPLFALMQINKDLTQAKEKIILSRMLLGNEKKEWANSLTSCYSILGTRVQMGHVTFQTASQVTARGYAGLTYFSSQYENIANVCFFPDPVCARLAMGMMIEDCKLIKDLDELGRDPKFWMEMATEMFSYGICRPEKGDIGEVACALYLLFCGDKIRYATDELLKQFSVPLDRWLSLLRDPFQDVPTEAKEPVASVSCVQVCRNYLRPTIEEIMHLLPHWYRSGRATYAYDACRAYDMIVPVRYRKQGAQHVHSSEVQYDYCPLLVSVKNHLKVARGAEATYKKAMKDVLGNAEIETGLCMLVLVGLTEDEITARESDNRMDFVFEENCVKCVTVVIKSDDPFGISQFLELTSMGGGERSEIYVSHSEAFSTPREIPTKNLLRKKGSDEACQYLDRLRDEFYDGKNNTEEKTEEKLEEKTKEELEEKIEEKPVRKRKRKRNTEAKSQSLKDPPKQSGYVVPSVSRSEHQCIKSKRRCLDRS